MADDGVDVRDALTAQDLAGAAVRVAEPELVDGVVHWVTSAPDGSGGSVLATAGPGGDLRVVSPQGVSIRSRLYGYGADAWCATDLGLVGIDASTQQLVVLAADRATPLGAATAPGDALGDPVAVPGSPWVVVVAEHHAHGGATRGLIAVDLASGATASLAVVDGWCAEPAVSADGTRLAWLRWPRRTMPWDAAELWVAVLERDGAALVCRSPRRVDGGLRTSVGQPTWRPDGSLAYVSEAAGYWQPWVCDDGGARRRLCGRHAEFQRPRWLTCGWLAALGTDGALACAFADPEGEHVGVLAPDGTLVEVDQPCVRVDGVCADVAAMAWVGATPTASGVVLQADVGGAGVRTVVGSVAVPVGMPTPETFRFDHDGARVDGALWRPVGVDAPVPLVVTVHPGPTGAVDRSYAPIVHLLVSHGIAVASCDVGGSTGHGRAHRERLFGRFGELDVAECVAATRHLVGVGVARADAVFVRGTSAGGTTALLSLATPEVRGAVAWYPASSFADDEGGLEEGYLDALLGDASAQERSPLARAGELSGRALVVQGELDEIVGLAETRRLVDALSRSLEAVELLVVPGEGHGFRTTAGRAAALSAELAFYLGVIGPRSGAPAAVAS